MILILIVTIIIIFILIVRRQRMKHIEKLFQEYKNINKDKFERDNKLNFYESLGFLYVYGYMDINMLYNKFGNRLISLIDDKFEHIEKKYLKKPISWFYMRVLYIKFSEIKQKNNSKIKKDNWKQFKVESLKNAINLNK